MSRVVCFFLEPTDLAQVSLRRYVAGGACEASGLGYHNAEADALVGPYNGDQSRPPRRPERADRRWPAACACGHRFAEGDQWQVNTRRLYRRSDDGTLVTLPRAPVGAIWDAPWMARGRELGDGRFLVVKTPGGDWQVDAPCADGSHWQRSGEPPQITVRPSVGMYGPDGRRWAYHGFLTRGVLESCGDSPT